MKSNYLVKFLTLGIMTLGLAWSCKTEDPKQPDNTTPASGDVTLTKQADVDAFAPSKTLTSLTIQGDDITDISKISVTTLETLVIKGTSITGIDTDSFSSISKKLEISGNSKLAEISKIGLKFCTGDITISDNAELTSIAGLLGLKKMTGKLVVQGNPKLGEDDGEAGEEWGFNVIKKLMEDQVITASQITLTDNHPGAATDPTMIGSMGSGMPSYTIRSAADLEAITKEECQDLTLLGADVDDQVWADIKLKGLKTVHGNLYAEGCNFTMCSNFFEKNAEGVVVEGGITFKNFKAYQDNDKTRFLNSDNVPTVVGGDLVLEQMWLHGWPGAGFNSITEVNGSITVKDVYTDNNCLFHDTKKVHGNVTIQGCKPGYNSSGTGEGPWNFDFGFEEIDGDLQILDNPWVIDLTGFTHLKKIGGKLVIKNNFFGGQAAGKGDGIAEIEAATGIGWDLVQRWIWDGVVDMAKVECYRLDGSKVEFAATEPEKPKDYVITSQGDIDAIQGEGLTAGSLTVRGSGVTNDVWANIKTKIAVVGGPLVVEDAALTMASLFFEEVQCKGDITLRNLCTGAGQYFNSDKFPAHVFGNLTIENVNIHGWANAGFNLVTEIDGSLYIKTAMMGNNTCFTALQRVGGDLTIDGPQADFSGNRIWNVDQWTIKQIGGKLSILNSKIVNLAGFSNITAIGGVYIKGNPDFNDFTQVKSWIDNNIVSERNVECYDGAGNRVDFSSTEPVQEWPEGTVTITSQEDIDALKGEGLTVPGLIVRGSGVTDQVWANIKTKIAVVDGPMLAEDAAFTMGTLFFKDVQCKGDITLRNICTGAGQYFNSDDFPKHVYGNLTIENVGIHGWANAGFNLVTEIDGNLTIKTAMMGNNTCFTTLQKVGGDVTIDGPQADFNGNRIWNVDQWTIKEIAGKLSIVNSKIVNLAGFGALTKLGALYVRGNADFNDFSIASTLIANGVLAKEKAECYDGAGNRVAF